MSERNYTVQTKINRPPSEVFAAIVNPDVLCRYFTDQSSGPLAVGDRVIWHWAAWGDFPVTVKQVEPPRLIHLQLDSREWQKTDPGSYLVDVFFELEALDDEATMLSISERGWQGDGPGLKASHENCSGWTHMAMCLKAHLEHELDFR